MAILGLGLIGGSLGLAWRSRPGGPQVVGFDPDPAARQAALAMGVVDAAADSIAGAVGRADVVVAACPVLKIPAVLREAAAAAPAGSLLTDVGSTKEWVVRELGGALPATVTYIGGHPLAGSEQGGVHAADPYLFENAIYVLTPTSSADPGAVERLSGLVRLTGAIPLILAPAEHDSIVAAVSHLPHLVAAALVNGVARLAETSPAMLGLAAGGFRDTTRVAGGRPELWRDILLSNAPRVAGAVDAFRSALEELAAALARGDGEQLTALLEAARQTRARLRENRKGLLPPHPEFFVHLPDRPGALAHVTSLLSSVGVNIADLELVRIREGEGGTCRVATADPGERDRAVALLRRQGYRVRAGEEKAG